MHVIVGKLGETSCMTQAMAAPLHQPPCPDGLAGWLQARLGLIIGLWHVCDLYRLSYSGALLQVFVRVSRKYGSFFFLIVLVEQKVCIPPRSLTRPPLVPLFVKWSVIFNGKLTKNSTFDPGWDQARKEYVNPVQIFCDRTLRVPMSVGGAACQRPQPGLHRCRYERDGILYLLTIWQQMDKIIHNAFVLFAYLVVF